MERKSGIVVIAGRPNAGKSTLLNRILGADLSIVSPKPQTTREGIKGILSQPQGQIVFVDTPGVHRAREDGVNAYMMSQVSMALEGPDLIWYLIDPRSALEPEKAVIERLAQAKAPVFLVLNKTDLKQPEFAIRAETLEREITETAEAAGIQIRGEFQISGKTGLGCENLMTETWELLKPGPILFPDEENLSDRNMRFFAAELVREQLFSRLGDELPYACAVAVTKFEEHSKPLHLEATIFVERDSQKGMVIGKGGAKIKEIGTFSRQRIEKFVDGKVFLGLKVEVLKNWSSDPERLRQLGYALPPKKRKN